LLQLQIGNEDAAVASVRRAMLETTGLLGRARILPGCIEVLLGAGHIQDASSAAEELVEISTKTSIDMHKAWSAYCSGVVALATSSPVEASSNLREPMRIWEDLNVPYELARARRDLGIALAEMGDTDGSEIQLEEARDAFTEMDAGPDAEKVSMLLSRSAARAPFGLTGREVEVLVRLTSGATNRSIAEDLVLSERTIDRHVSNIFTKLGVNTRSAATAAAIRNEIV
jgi:DNA-binding CsgD family transcriptional regulator